jgi:Holliday junction resolvase RusA-like endonuclease
MTEYAINPCAAPRMTRSDKWKTPRRPCVARYFAFRDRVKALNIKVPVGAHITFYLPTPASWSKKTALAMQGEPQKQTPDLDNLIKALLDSVYGQDKHIWKLTAEKRWRDKPGIKVEP